MILSVTFSFVLYRVTSGEIQTRLEQLQTNLQQSEQSNRIPQPPQFRMMQALRENEVNVAAVNLSAQLIYVNISVFFIGGFISYFLARRSLKPIEEAHEVQSRFTSDASHELRTPLAVMKTELEVALRDDNATIDGLKEVLRSNLEEVDKLTKLSEMLLNISKLDNSGLKFSPVNLQKVIRETIKQFGKKTNRIVLDSTKAQTVYGNEIAISEVIKILVDNALQYSPPESLVRISLKQDDRNVIFCISNEGPGIKADKLPHVFDRFYRADASRTNGKHKGYGLGLALAKNITELHSGGLTVSSTPNKETTFTLVLPIDADIQANSKP